MAFTGFSPTIAGLLQLNFLAREMEEGLDSSLAYRRLAIQELFPGRIGETLVRTRTGRLAPVTTPMVPYAQGASPNITSSTLDNGLALSTWSIEQYSFVMAEYAATQDLNMMQEQAQIADQFIKNARNNGVQAAQSLERICRLKLFNAYLSGNTRTITMPGGTIITGGTATNTTSNANGVTGIAVNVDDIRGFTTVLVNGVPTPIGVSGAVLPITVGGNLFNVTAVTPYNPTGGSNPSYLAGQGPTNVTSTPDAVPGMITLTNTGATYAIAIGDPVLASNAPAVFRPSNRTTTLNLVSTDVITLGVVEDAIAYLRDNGVPPMDDGTYHCILDNTSMRQMFADPDFKVLYAGRYQSSEWQQGEVIRLLGVTFVPTTEAYVQILGALKIRRPIIAGAEAIIQGNFEGMETWLSERGFDRDDSAIAMVDGVVQIVRPPLDRLQQIVSMTWTWIGDYAVPTDNTATTSIIPTASSALFKRCAVVEHVG